MSIERASGGSSPIDVFDRVLDKGIVIDAWVRLFLVGIDLIYGRGTRRCRLDNNLPAVLRSRRHLTRVELSRDCGATFDVPGERRSRLGCCCTAPRTRRATRLYQR